MKTRYILIAVAALAVSACAKTNEQPVSEGMQKITIHASQEGAIDTKTTVQDCGTQVYWEPADQIKVFFKGTGSRFVSQNTENATSAVFSGSMNVLVGMNEGDWGHNEIWGLYPNRTDATSDGSSVTTTLQSLQAGRGGSFAKNTHITLARSSSFDLAFYNVTGGLRFSVTQEGIKKVTFEGNNGETLAGRIRLAFDNNVPYIEEVTEDETVLTLLAPGGTFQPGEWYYIEAIPVSLPNGFTMNFYKAAESSSISSSNPVSIMRGRYGSLPNIDKDLAFTDYEGDQNSPISIDGDMNDWADKLGAETPDNICKAMKVWNDDENFYVYLASEPGPRGSALWGEASGYYCIDFDWDNNPETGIAENSNPGFDCWFYMYVFGGTADAPFIKEHPNGDGKQMSIDNITAMGVITSELIEIELSIPRADMVEVAAGTLTRILSRRSKDGTVIEMTYIVQ